MHHAVAQFGEFCRVPAVGGSHKVTCDALQAVDVLAAAHRTFFQSFLRVFVAAVHTAIPGVVYRSLAYVVLVHQVHYLHHCFGVVGGVAVYFYIEDVAAALQIVIWRLDFGFMTRTAVVIHGHVARIGVVVLVGDAGHHTKFLTVLLGEAS